MLKGLPSERFPLTSVWLRPLQGVVSWASIYPLDVVKNRLQAAPNRYRCGAVIPRPFTPPHLYRGVTFSVSRRLFLTVGRPFCHSRHARCRGIVHCFRVSVQEEGYGCLVRGLKACLLRAFLVNAAIFCGYESATEAMMRWGMLERQPGVDAAGLSHHPEQLHKT